MAEIIRNEVVLPYQTDLPRDCAINTFHFLTEDAFTGDNLTDQANMLDQFYNEVPPDGAQSIAFYISSYVRRETGACTIRQYQVIDATHSTWLQDVPFTLDAPSSLLSLPFEVSICASFYATPAFVVPIRRRRGRVYLGPLTIDIMGTPSDAPPVAGALANREDIAAACQRMADIGTDDRWAIYSRVNNQAYEVSSGWVDNEFDTQRRRQVEATSRVSWTIT